MAGGQRGNLSTKRPTAALEFVLSGQKKAGPLLGSGLFRFVAQSRRVNPAPDLPSG
jgi:hypothetical protein